MYSSDIMKTLIRIFKDYDKNIVTIFSVAKMDVLTAHTIMTSAMLAQDGKYTMSRERALMNQRVAWRNTRWVQTLYLNIQQTTLYLVPSTKQRYIGIIVPLSVQLSCECNSFLTDKLILMKLYTAAVYTLKMCIKGDYPGLNYFKGDNL